MTVGTSQARLMLGFMITTMFLSMWISNTATTAMMIPILEVDSSSCLRITEYPPTQAVLVELGPQHRTMMMLAVAFSANIGGTATLIGTPPNLIMYEYLSAYPGHPVTFGALLVTTRAENEV